MLSNEYQPYYMRRHVKKTGVSPISVSLFIMIVIIISSLVFSHMMDQAEAERMLPQNYCNKQLKVLKIKQEGNTLKLLLLNNGDTPLKVLYANIIDENEQIVTVGETLNGKGVSIKPQTILLVEFKLTDELQKGEYRIELTCDNVLSDALNS